MKGHPGTGKSTLAAAIAGALRIPILDKDDIRDAVTIPLRPHVPPELLNELSYAVLHRLVATQVTRLHLPLLLVDSPLSRRARLDALQALGARVLIVECRPADQSEWRRRLERRGEAMPAEERHKPTNWADLTCLVESYAGCDDYEMGDVERIVIDTTEPEVPIEDMVDRVIAFLRRHITGEEFGRIAI